MVTALEATTGEMVWRERTGEIFSASPVFGDGKIYMMSETGATLVLEPGREFKIVARNQIEGRIAASPAIAGGRIFVRTDDRVLAIGGPAR